MHACRLSGKSALVDNSPVDTSPTFTTVYASTAEMLFTVAVRSGCRRVLSCMLFWYIFQGIWPVPSQTLTQNIICTSQRLWISISNKESLPFLTAYSISIQVLQPKSLPAVADVIHIISHRCCFTYFVSSPMAITNVSCCQVMKIYNAWMKLDAVATHSAFLVLSSLLLSSLVPCNS